MGKRVSIAVCLTLGVSFALGAGCTSIPDSRKILPAGYDGGGGDGGADSGTGTGNRTGSSGRTGAGGAGTAGGGAGASAGGGTGAGGTIVTVEGGLPDGGEPPGKACGAAVCHDRHIGGASLAACCAGKNGDKCGFETAALGTTACVAVNQVGTLDSGCGDQTFGDSTFRGCCRPNATCGLFIQPAGGPNFGCVDPTEVGISTTSSCTPAVCNPSGSVCTKDKDCCAGAAGQPACIQFTGASDSTCTEYCVTNGDCATGCCIPLDNGGGACAPKDQCGAQCRKAAETCDADADCCTDLLCAANSDFGPRLCKVACTSNSDCAPDFCAQDAGGRSTCTTFGAGLCSDTCKDANDTYCDDGGPSSEYSSCLRGTDCTDCAVATKTNGVRLGGTSRCFDSCGTSNNGKCEDGGTASVSGTCSFGSDCTDCGPRLGLCVNDCQYANDGSCDDGGPGSAYSGCNLGTDCVDCGVRYAGRGQTPCDGTNGVICQPSGGLAGDYMMDDKCQCDDCAWDSGPRDCKATASKCDGKTISACCAPGNPCNFDGDGFCDCGGWCEWEKKDCGAGATGPRCDGVATYWSPSSCDYTMPKAPDTRCDCYGACSFEGNDCKATLGTTCTDTCTGTRVHNGICEDGGLNSTTAVCAKGTDCADCGPR